jgi:predicted metal-dependent peptidase
MTTQETRLKKAHVALMRHPETALYSGIMMMGDSTVVDDCPTAYTDGVNKKYGRAFIEKLEDDELRALVVHENLHIALKHIQRFKKEWEDNPMLLNASADYVVNDIICNLEDQSFLRLPQGGLYDDKYHNWSVREVMNDLKQQQEDGKQTPQSSMDEHDFESGAMGEGGQPMSVEDQKQLSKEIDRALREGGILAGRLGAKIPRNITDLLEPKIDWKTVLRDFIMSQMKGTDEYTWRKYNKRLVANDIYMPSMEDERVGELTIAIDTSGSIGEDELNAFTSELVSICSVSTPEKVRILWWDTEVHGEQTFDESQYDNIAKLVKPQGGGGTDLSCVVNHINKENINSQAIIVLTDGYFSTPEWNTAIPTLFVTTGTENYIPSNCKIVKQDLT